MTPAAIYCRSSKDRAEIGLDIQRKELTAYAKQHGMRIVAEFSDMEISGSLDETSRPGLAKMLTALGAEKREWSVLLAVDTSRIARDVMLGLYVRRECDKHGVQMQFSKVAVNANDPMGEMLLGQLALFDRLHSRMSALKGRAGLEVNVGNGYRAGGRAPFGYKLQHTETGGTRGGMAVKKSKLVLDAPNAKKVQLFLQQRAAGVARHIAAKEARMKSPVSSLIGMERNALTYAGLTVWNMRQKHKPTREDSRKTMLWRPREEWVISEQLTHEALITREEAERIIALVDALNPKARKRGHQPDTSLLTGMLFTPDGSPYQADGPDYRVRNKGKRFSRAQLDSYVLTKLAREIRGEAFVAEVVQRAHEMAEEIEDSPQALDAALQACTKKIDGLATIIAETHNKVLVAKLEELQAERERIAEARATAAERARVKTGLRGLTAKHVEAMLEFAAVPLPGEELDVAHLRRTLGAFVHRIVLDPGTRDMHIEYSVKLHVPNTGVYSASPRGLAINPARPNVHFNYFLGQLPVFRRGPAPSRENRAQTA
jgi:DNA invertase Pin-like site-specific DNA recombinase